MKAVQPVEVFMGKLPHGADLLDELNRICQQKNISLGKVEALGAVKKACVGFYDQESRIYQFLNLDYPLEITNLVGNISLKDGVPFVHAHITLSDQEGRAFGGHLVPGTIVFACEAIIQVFTGTVLQRHMDQETGLPLWLEPPDIKP